MRDFLETVFQISVLVFVVGSMIRMGLSLTLRHILEPLKNKRLVVLSLIANFVLVPLFVYVLVSVIPVSEGERIALILISLAGGAPFLPKLAGVAKSNTAFATGLMLLLMTVTIFYLPLMLPLLLDGAQVSSWEIAKSLIVLMLAPLVMALAVRATAEGIAKKSAPWFAAISDIALVLLTIALIILNIQGILGMAGSGVVAIILLVVGGMVIGYFLGGKDKDTKIVLALGTGQRNVSAAILVAAQNFADDPGVALTLVVLGVLGLVIMIPLARKIGKRASLQI